jgi:hypothetical protein
MKRVWAVALLLVLTSQLIGLAGETMQFRWCELGEVGDWNPFNWRNGAVLALTRQTDSLSADDILCVVPPNAKIMVLPDHIVPTGAVADPVTCRVQGYVYSMPGETPDFTKVDSCMGVRWRIDIENHALILWSPMTMVTIPLPQRTDGQMIIQYQWRKPTAQIGGRQQAVHVEEYSGRG